MAEASEKKASSAPSEIPGEPTATKPAGKPAGGKVKPEKPPAVEAKPFAEFIQQDYLPGLQAALAKNGVDSVDLKLVKQKLPLPNAGSGAECWQVIGSWPQSQRQFNLYFLKQDINGPRMFTCSSYGTQPSTIEPFLMDERKITLDLLVFGVVQRLNAQKWLTLN